MPLTIRNLVPVLPLLFLASSLAAGPGLAAPVNETRLNDAAAESANWLSHGRDYAETRFSPLTEINAGNVADLGLAWSADLDERRGLQGTPLVVDGAMYVTGSWSRLYAFSAADGKPLWRYDPGVDRKRAYAFCCGVVNRGAAIWEGKLYIGTLDGYLVAVDATTGKELWRTLTVDQDKPYSITGAPRVVKGKVIIGNGGAEYGVRGYVSAFDADSGEQIWRFWTVPGNPTDGFENPQMEAAAKTWSGPWWKFGGGGTVWDSMSYDPELDLLYIGVGNGGPHNRRIRSPGGGDNLYLSSVVALRPDTGEYVWHYQETPADSWDFTATQNMILADIAWRGETRKVLLHAPKNGFFFVIDRLTGELLSAQPFVPVSWASHYDMDTARPVETPNADYADGGQWLRPTGIGGHNWHPMSYNPHTGLVYIPALDLTTEFKDDPEGFTFYERHWNIGYDTTPRDMPAMLLAAILERLVNSYLIAWDPVKQQQAWKIAIPKLGNGGTLTTGGGLVFQGHSGDQFVAYDASTGEQLWSFYSQNGIMAAPVTYAVSGEQYVAIQVGRGGGLSMAIGIEHPATAEFDRVLVFKLGGSADLPPLQPAIETEPPPQMPATSDELTSGSASYARFCMRCHGAGVVSDGSIPDLRLLNHAQYRNFDNTVLHGTMESAGMPRFDDVLNDKDVHNIKAYVLHKATERADDIKQPEWWRDLKMWFYGVLADLILAVST